MDCGLDVRTINGKPSELYYNILNRVENAEIAHRLSLQVRTEKFKDWFNNSKHIDENGEPTITTVDGEAVYTNNKGEHKSIYNTGSFGTQYTPIDVIKHLQGMNIVGKRKFNGDHWIKKGLTVDGENELNKNLAAIDRFNDYYINKHGAPLVFVYKSGTSHKVTVNELLLSKINYRNQHDIYYSNVSEDVGDMDRRYINVEGGLSSKLNKDEESYGINIIGSIAIKLKDSLSKLKMKDAIEGDTVRAHLANNLIRFSTTMRNSGVLNEHQHQTNLNIADETITNDLFWNRIKHDIKRTSGYIIDDNIQADDGITNSFDENLQFKVAPDRRADVLVKELINTTPVLNKDYKVINNKKVYSKNRNTPGGLSTTMRFYDVSNFLVQLISKTKNVADMISTLEMISDRVDPSYRTILAKLKTNTSLANLFFRSFKNESLNRVSTTVNPNADKNEDKIKTNIQNKKSYLPYQIADGWINTLNMYKVSNFYVNTGTLRDIRITYKAFLNAKGNTKLDLLERFFALTGVDINRNVLEGIVFNDANRNMSIPSNIDNIEDYKTEQAINNFFTLAAADIYSYVTFKGSNKDLKSVKILGNLYKLAKNVDIFYMPINNSYINTTGNQEQTFNKPSYIGDWFDMMANDDDVFLEHLKSMARDPKLKFSNWLISTKEHDGFLKLPDNISIKDLNENIDKLELNKDFYYDKKTGEYKFNIEFFDGLIHIPTNKYMRYTDITDIDWNYNNIANYFNNETTARYPILSLSDKGNTRVITAPKFTIKESDVTGGTRLNRNTKLYQAVFNIFKSELNRIDKEYKYVFNERGEVRQNIENLYVNYHYRLNDNNEPVFFDSNGNPVGEAFKFHSFNYINGKGVEIDFNKIFTETPDISIINDEEINAKIHAHITRMISRMVNKQLLANKAISKILTKDITNKTNLKYETAILEYTVNRYIANTEMMNFYMGDAAFYKDSNDMNKRAAQLISSGVINGAYGTMQSFYGITAHDRYITDTKFINRMKRVLRKLGHSKEVVKFVTDSYKNINTTDAQSYITLDEFENRMRLFGVLDKFAPLIARARNVDTELDVADLTEFANALKNFYYSYQFDGIRFVPNQVKNSEQVLIPSLIKGTELEVLHDTMVKHGVSQINFVSGEKVGSKYITTISDEKGNLTIDEEDFAKAKNVYYYRNLRKQQDAVNHNVDESNKLGVQIAKKILDNLADKTKAKELLSLYVSNIEESAERLLDEFGITKENGVYRIDKSRLSEVLIRSGISKGTTNNILKGFELELGEFKIPLDHITNRLPNEAMINSIFTNRVINQKFPGTHGAQMSNAFMRKLTKAGKPIGSSDLSYSYFVDSKDGLVHHIAQVKLPYWSKSFFDGGKKVTIEQLKELGLNTMIGYRIPTEDKHSMFVFEVVEFLDESAGSTIVVPDAFIAQTGSDFDYDTIYTMLFSHRLDKDGNLHKIEYTTSEEDLNDRYINYVNDLHIGYSKKELAQEIIDKANRSYAAYKATRTRLKNERNEAAKEEYDNIASFVSSTSNVKLKDDIADYINMLKKDGLSMEEQLSFLYMFVSGRVNYIQEDIELRKKHNGKYKQLEPMLDTYLILELYLKDSVNYLNGITDDIQKYNDSIKEKMQARYWDTFSVELAKSTARLVGLETLDEFSKRGIEHQNIKKARDNRILQLYIDILTSPDSYLEMSSPNTFEDILQARDLAEGLHSKYGTMVNYADPTNQDVYRSKALAGRELKKHSVNRDSFVSIAQHIGLRLDVPIYYKFDTSEYKLEKLKEVFGEDNVSDDGRVDLQIIANNNNGTFTNIDGRLYTSYVAQSTANTFDNVKFPLPYNVNDKTFNVWRLLPELGATWKTATLFINQEAISHIIDGYNLESSAFMVTSKSAVDYARRKIQIEILIANLDSGKLDSLMYDEDYLKKIIRNVRKYGRNAYVSDNFLDRVGAYFARPGAISDSILKDGLSKYGTKMSSEVAHDYYTKQLAILDMYVSLNSIADQTSDFQRVTSFDKREVGPSFADNNDIYEHIDKITDINDEGYVNGLVTKDGEHYYDAIYEDGYESAYPSLKSYFKNGIILADKIFANEFITNSPSYIDMVRHMPKYKRDAIIAYTMAENLASLPFFANTDVNQLLGVNASIVDLDISTINSETVSKFSKLSVANKLSLIKEQYRDYIDKTNVLYYINPIVDSDYTSKYNKQGISFVVESNTDDFVDSFAKIWYNKNPYYHLLARDLVKYAFFNNGLNFGRNLSKIIPTSVLSNSPITLETINGINIIKGIGYTSHMYRSKLRHYHYKDINYGIYHRIKFARASTHRNYIVPKIPSNDLLNVEFKPDANGIVEYDIRDFYKLPKEVRGADVVVKWRNTGTRKSPIMTPTYYAKIPITLVSDVEYDVKKVYYVPVNKLEPYEFTERSRIDSNNVHEPIDYYLSIIERNIPEGLVIDEMPDVSEINKPTSDGYVQGMLFSNVSESFNDEINTLPKTMTNFLNKLNFTVEFRDELRSVTGYDALGATDLIYKAVMLRNDYNNKSFAKQTAYVAYAMLGKKNKIRTDLVHSIENMDNYTKVFADYKARAPHLNDYKLKELIVVDYLADAIINNYENPKDSYINRKAEYWHLSSKTQLGKKIELLLSKIKQFIQRLFGNSKLNTTELNNLLDDIANDVLKRNFSKFGTTLDADQQLTNYNEVVDNDNFAKEIIQNFQQFGAILTGSLSLRMEGTIYRTASETLHGLDFTLHHEALGDTFKAKYDKYFKDIKGLSKQAKKPITKKLIKELVTHPLFNDIIAKYPNFKIVNSFVNSNTVTITGKIDEYMIDIFFVNENNLDTANRGWQDWQPIFKAKIRMGRQKDIRDFANYIPFNPSPDNKARDVGFRYFEFNSIREQIDEAALYTPNDNNAYADSYSEYEYDNLGYNINNYSYDNISEYGYGSESNNPFITGLNTIIQNREPITIQPDIDETATTILNNALNASNNILTNKSQDIMSDDKIASDIITSVATGNIINIINSYKVQLSKFEDIDTNTEQHSTISELLNEDTDFINYNKNIIKHLQAITSDYKLRSSIFPGNELLKSTNKRLDAITYSDAVEADIAAALRVDADYAVRTVAALEKAFYDKTGYLHKDNIKAASKDPVKRVELTTFMNYANTFLKGLSKIKDLQTIKKDNLTDSEKEINKAIKRLTSITAKVNQLKSTHTSIMNTFFEYLLSPISTNPNIKLGFRNIFDVQDDESKLMLFLDPLMDTNHSFVANFIKKLYVDNGIKDELTEKAQEAYDNIIKKFKEDGITFEDIVDSNNNLIQEFDERYKKDLEDLTTSLYEIEETSGKYSKAYYNAERKLKKWKLDNLSSEEMHELELAKFNANDILNKHIEARKKLDAIKEKRRLILNNYKGIFDYGVMTKEDIETLHELEQDKKMLASTVDLNGNKKSDADIAIAKTIQKYNEAYNDIYEKYYEPIIAINEYKKLLDKYKNEDSEEARKWLHNNTKVKPVNGFWELFKTYKDILGRETTKDDVLGVLNAMKDIDGIVNGIAVSDKLRAKIKEANEARTEGVELRNPKAIEKPKNNNHYNDSYYAWFDRRGTDSRDDNDEIDKLKYEISLILFSYIGDNGLLDTTKISIDDMIKLANLEDKISELGLTYDVDAVRVAFNEWFNKTHDTVFDRKAFKEAETKAKAVGRKYYNQWRKINTSLHYNKSYYTWKTAMLKKYGLKGKVKTKATITSINMDFVRNHYNIDDINKLPTKILNAIFDKKHTSLYKAKANIYTLADYLRPHKVYNPDSKSPYTKYITKKFDTYEDAAKHLKDLYEAEKYRQANKKVRFLEYKDAIDEATDYTYTKKYYRLLKKHGKDSDWYLNNHIINYKGDIVPAHYWVIERPHNKSFYEENAPTKKYWGYNKVTEDSYIDANKTTAKTWFNKNVNYVTTKYYDKVKAEMIAKRDNGTISALEYNKWYDDNHYYNPYTNKYEPISMWTHIVPSTEYIDEYAPLDYAIEYNTKEEYINKDYRTFNDKALPTKSSKYYNKDFEAFKNTRQYALYKYINELLIDLSKHYHRDTILDEQKLPIMFKHGDKASDLLTKLIKKAGWFSYPSREVAGENDEGVRILSLPGVSMLSEKDTKLIDLPNENEFDNRHDYLVRYNEVRRQNKEIRAAKERYTNEHMNKDWANVVRSFIKIANDHKFQYNKEHEMRLALEQIRNLDLAKKRGVYEHLKNATRNKLAKRNPELYADDTGLTTEKGINSNLEQHFRAFMDMIFYGEFEKDEKTLSKISRVLQNFTSAKGMWLNTTGAFNNVAYGRTQMALTHWGGYYYTKADAFQADIAYMGSLMSIMVEANKETSSTITNALIKKFKVLELQDELAISSNTELNKAVQHHLISTNSLYFMHHFGEHYMQNIALLAMLRSHRLVGGEIKSLTEYTFDLQYKAIMSVLDDAGKTSLDKFIRDNKYEDRFLDGKYDLIREFILSRDTNVKKTFLNNLKELKETAKKEFETNKKLIDIYELKDGKAVVKTGYNISDEQFQLFKLKVIKVNQKVHGIYNKFDAGTIQRYAIGRLAMQFRKWMRPGFTKRFGTRIGKAHWNEGRNELDKGMYVSTFQFLTRPIADAINEAKGEDGMVMKILGNIFSNYATYIGNIGIYWATLSDTEKSDIRSTIAETLEFAMVMVMLTIARGFARGDKDDKKWAYALYSIDRLRSEILAYNPLYGFQNETKKLLRDPFAAMSALDDAAKLLYTAMFEQDMTYKGGVYHGNSKLYIQTMKNIPLFNRYLRYENIQDYAGYYKLYGF